PNACAIAKQLAEPNRDRGGHRLTLFEDVVEVLAGDAEQRCNLGLALAGRRDHFAQQCTGMRRAPIGVALGGVFGHGSAPQWYCSKSTRSASPESNSKVMHQGPFTWTV